MTALAWDLGTDGAPVTRLRRAQTGLRRREDEPVFVDRSGRRPTHMRRVLNGTFLAVALFAISVPTAEVLIDGPSDCYATALLEPAVHAQVGTAGQTSLTLPNTPGCS